MSLFSGIKSFLAQKFLVPLTDETVFYNPTNTAVYSTLFAVAGAYIGFPVLKKLDIRIGKEFFTGIAPFIFLGGAVRVLEDLNIVDSVLIVTPFIYGIMFLVVGAALIGSRQLEKYFDVPYHETMLLTGTAMLIGVLLLIPFRTFSPVLYTAGIYLPLVAVLYLGTGKFRPELKTPEFLLPVAAHYFDGVTSTVAISMGAEERHVLGSIFVDLMGPVGMLVMKSLVILPVVYYLNELDIDRQKKLYYLFLVALLGFALGTRNLMTSLA